MTALKVVVTGTFNAGKTRFIRSASDGPPVLTEELTFGVESGIKKSTTTALDYGKVVMPDGMHLYLFGTPGQDRFSFMRDVLAQGMDAYILVVDSTDGGAILQARVIGNIFAAMPPVPWIVAATKVDLPGALDEEELRRYLDVPLEIPIVPCNAQQRSSVHHVLATLLALPTVKARSS